MAREIRELTEHEIGGTTADLASHDRVKAFAFLSEVFTVENGMFTPKPELSRGEIGKVCRADQHHL